MNLQERIDTLNKLIEGQEKSDVDFFRFSNEFVIGTEQVQNIIHWLTELQELRVDKNLDNIPYREARANKDELEKLKWKYTQMIWKDVEFEED